MDFVLILIGFAIIATIFMNVMAMNIIKSSQIHEAKRKQNLNIILWALPLLGVFVVIRLINRDIKKNQEKMEDEIAPAIREVADKLKVLDADLSQGRINKIAGDDLNQNKKIH